MDDKSLTFTTNPDGTISVKNEQGAETRYAKESDLLAVKGSAEVAAKAAKEVQDTHNAEVNTANTSLESTRQEMLRAEAKIEELEKKVSEGAGSAEELATVKQSLETAKKSGEDLTTKVLEFRRTLLVATFGIPADTVKDKTLEQLDSYEEALKAVMAAKGIGNYAVGGGGGAGATPEKPLDRARRIIEETEAKGGGGGGSFSKPEGEQK